MEWYFGSEIDDFVVPKDEEVMEGIESPDSWSKWGIAAFGGPEIPKMNFGAGVNLNRDEQTCNGKRFYCASNTSNPRLERDHSNSSSQGLFCDSLMWTTAPHEQADYQFTEEQARINRMDDIFFNSLLEEDLTNIENLNGSSGYSPESHNSTVPSDNILKDMILESKNIPSLAHDVRRPKYHRRPAFPSSLDIENGEVSSSCPLIKQGGSNSYAREVTSLEESVLQELSRVTAQFTEKTRICFRDAFYRLAESSKQTLNSTQDGDNVMEFTLPSEDDTLRLGEAKDSESKTNSIDRAVANLMFSQPNFSDEDNETSEELHYNMPQPHLPFCTQRSHLTGDAEVPVVGQVNFTSTNGQPIY